LCVARTRISLRATTYKSIDVDGLSIFYREAGSPGAPTLLLLHGFPSSSRMYGPLFPRLADAVHLVAPDYPGFGHSDAPGPEGVRLHFRQPRLHYRTLHRAHAYRPVQPLMQDYGGPVGFRLAVALPTD
jgi:pimeloyl-ACP methyl ester carboxylesterase